MTQKSIPHIKLFCSSSGQFDIRNAFLCCRIQELLDQTGFCPPPLYFGFILSVYYLACAKFGGCVVSHRHLQFWKRKKSLVRICIR